MAKSSEKAGGTNKGYEPLLDDWEVWMCQDDMDLCVGRLMTITDFWMSEWGIRVDMPKCMIIHGWIYGRDGTADGTEYNTSWVKTIVRVKRQIYCGLLHDLMRAVTYSGEEYYFYSDGYSVRMGLLLSNLMCLRLDLEDSLLEEVIIEEEYWDDEECGNEEYYEYEDECDDDEEYEDEESDEWEKECEDEDWDEYMYDDEEEEGEDE